MKIAQYEKADLQTKMSIFIHVFSKPTVADSPFLIILMLLTTQVLGFTLSTDKPDVLIVNHYLEFCLVCTHK